MCLKTLKKVSGVLGPGRLFFPLPTIVSPVRRKKNRTDFFLFAFGRKVFVIFAIKLRKDSIEFTLLFLKA